jgi:hypothetical protein
MYCTTYLYYIHARAGLGQIRNVDFFFFSQKAFHSGPKKVQFWEAAHIVRRPNVKKQHFFKLVQMERL